MHRPILSLSLLFILIALCTLRPWPAYAQRPAADIHWLTSSQEAAEEAKRTGQPIMLYLYADGDPGCRALERKTYSDPKVRALAERMVCLRLDGRKAEGAALGRRFHIEGYPTVLFLTPTGEVINLVTSYRNASEYAVYMVYTLMRSTPLPPAKKVENGTTSEKPEEKTEPKTDGIVWRVLLVIVPFTQVTVTQDGQTREVNESLTQEDIQLAQRSFARFPGLVASLTQNQVKVEARWVQAVSPITSVSPIGSLGYFPNVQDAYPIIERYNRSGEYYSIAVYWKGRSLQHAWGLGGMLTPKGSTYFVVEDASPGSWQADNRGEVFLHEWTHGIAAYFRTLGYKDCIPPQDADGGGAYGYTRSPTDGWCSYYFPLFNGLVPIDGTLKGFNSEMWQRGAPRHRRAEPYEPIKPPAANGNKCL